MISRIAKKTLMLSVLVSILSTTPTKPFFTEKIKEICNPLIQVGGNLTGGSLAALVGTQFHKFTDRNPYGWGAAWHLPTFLLARGTVNAYTPDLTTTTDENIITNTLNKISSSVLGIIAGFIGWGIFAGHFYNIKNQSSLSYYSH